MTIAPLVMNRHFKAALRGSCCPLARGIAVRYGDGDGEFVEKTAEFGTVGHFEERAVRHRDVGDPWGVPLMVRPDHVGMGGLEVLLARYVVTPDGAALGFVTLSGCGWLPADDLG